MTHRIFFFFYELLYIKQCTGKHNLKIPFISTLTALNNYFKKCSYLSITQFTVVSVRVWDTGRQTTELPLSYRRSYMQSMTIKQHLHSSLFIKENQANVS